jgi:hypothetical protein
VHFSIFNGHLVIFWVVWYILPSFGIMYYEKSGNPGGQLSAFQLTRDRRGTLSTGDAWLHVLIKFLSTLNTPLKN